jgi:hypothetical protein
MSGENLKKKYVGFTQHHVMKTLQLMESDKMITLELKDRTGGRDTVFCVQLVAARYELDSPGFETGCARDFRTHLVKGPSRLLCNG